ncbi:hypothetical protein [Massilia phosphatilytica]
MRSAERVSPPKLMPPSSGSVSVPVSSAPFEVLDHPTNSSVLTLAIRN